MNRFPYTTPDARPYRDLLRLNAPTGHPLPATLAMAVPFEIAKLVERGGPTDMEWEMTALWADTLGAHGDDLLYGGKKGAAANLFADLARAVAILAFVPGGITIFGNHYEASVTNEAVR